MGFLLSKGEDVVTVAASFPIDLASAILSLLTALVVAFGPSIAKKIWPPDPTMADLAKTSTESVAASLETTLKLVRDDFGDMRRQIADNGKKIDSLRASGGGKK